MRKISVLLLAAISASGPAFMADAAYADPAQTPPADQTATTDPTTNYFWLGAGVLAAAGIGGGIALSQHHNNAQLVQQPPVSTQ